MASSKNTRREFVKNTVAATGTLTLATPLLSTHSSLSRLPLKTVKTEVLVCGGGCAGIAAALASARSGAKTVLVERAGFAGGIITCVGLPYFDGLIDKPTGRFVTFGIVAEFLQKMGVAKPGAKHIDDCRPDLITKYWGSVLIDNTEQFKVLCDDLIQQQSDHLSVLYHTTVCDTEVKDGRISAVMIANKDGITRIEAKQVIDCTGDADVATWSGAPVEKTTPLMPLTLHFRIGNVKRNPEMTEAAKQEMIKANQRGELPLFYGPGLIFAFAKDEAYVHAVRVAADASNAADLTRAEMQGRKDAWTMFSHWKKSVPGFEDSYFITSGPYIGVRESRRIIGQHVLSVDDLRITRQHADAVATGCWFVDIHPNKITTDKPFAGSGFQPKPYDISYRSLVPQKLSNLLVAGRCHSASADAAASSRVTATAMVLGEAAGTAAALAVKARTEVALFDGVKVRERLAQRGAGPFSEV
ncbi:FAD-dependent oxidoreductase [Larkinella rosea]|uniref:FAD-dependent oxidoreductase n=1 Tax=Larkinella rosea TaxID=2025312 RepID=A0A3P1BS53_9BACT|nr:FAD-dependent oxidoreductase [Larkinella rosea]RRB03686.1 FAD-dependent oxidoreductase [Larkinella rosea]